MELMNHIDGLTESVHAFDSGSTMNLIRRSVVDRLKFTGRKFTQKCRGFVATAETAVESTALNIRGLAEERSYILNNVGIMNSVPVVAISMPHTLAKDLYPEFRDIKYPVLDCGCCNFYLEEATRTFYLRL